RLLAGDVGEQASLRELRWKVGVLCAGVASLNCVDRSACVMAEVELAGVVFTEGDDANRGTGNFGHFLGAIPFEPSGPKTARFPVAEDIGAHQLGKFATAIDVAAGDAAAEGV